MPKTSYTFRDGRTVEWTGADVSICTECDDIFNSGAAFDHHLKPGKKGQPAIHDISGMPRNKRGYLVTALFDDKAYETTSDKGFVEPACPNCEEQLEDEAWYLKECPYCGESLYD